MDWAKVAAETVEHFVQLIRIDTSNPPGNETNAARYLESVLTREGIPCTLFAVEPKRANLIARLRGDGSKRPILIMGHTDVVGVQREKWPVDPFAGLRKDGVIWGRGTQDDKDHVASGLMLMLLLKRLQVPLARDVIFVAEAGEEGTTHVGIRALVSHKWPDIEAEFALAEGGAVVAQNGKVLYVGITTTEKVPRGIRLVAHGDAGHGSRPTPNNAVVRLAAAVAKAGAWHTPMRLNDTTRAYFERLATISPPEQAWRYQHMTDAAAAPAIDKFICQHELTHCSMIRTSISPTVMKAGFRSNVIPSQAEAYLDVRALPDEDMGKLIAGLKKVIDDPAVEVVPPPTNGRPASPPSRMDSELFRALEKTQRRMFPGAITVPTMLTGATDMAQLRAKGVQAYGWGGIVDSAETGGGAHSDDEHIAETTLHQMVRFLWLTVLDTAAR